MYSRLIPAHQTVNVTMTSYVIAVSTTVAAREGVCPTEYDAPVEIDTTGEDSDNPPTDCRS